MLAGLRAADTLVHPVRRARVANHKSSRLPQIPAPFLVNSAFQACIFLNIGNKSTQWAVVKKYYLGCCGIETGRRHRKQLDQIFFIFAREIGSRGIVEPMPRHLPACNLKPSNAKIIIYIYILRPDPARCHNQARILEFWDITVLLETLNIIKLFTREAGVVSISRRTAR